MNSTHKKLFVRRNIKSKVKVYRDVESKYNRKIKTVAQINENIFLAGFAGKTSYDKLLEKDNAESLRKQLKPLLIFLRLLGCFPVYFSKSGYYKRARTHHTTHIHTCIYILVYIYI